jgi:hypothetical protein
MQSGASKFEKKTVLAKKLKQIWFDENEAYPSRL